MGQQSVQYLNFPFNDSDSFIYCGKNIYRVKLLS